MKVELDAIQIAILEELVNKEIHLMNSEIKQNESMPNVIHFLKVNKSHLLDIKKQLSDGSGTDGTNAANYNDTRLCFSPTN